MRTLTYRFVALAIALSLFVPTVTAAPVRVGNVMPLHDQAGRNFCTAWHINSKDDLWATAGHCVVGAMRRGMAMMISGKRAELIFIAFDENRDIAVLQVSGLKATPFRLADKAPKRGDEIVVAGYPYGFPVLVVTPGVIAARKVPIGPQPVSDILTAIVAGGSSGSPVLKDGRVVGLLWGVFTESPHSLAIPFETVKRDIGAYFER